jgi:hypothetical protein
MSSENDVIKHYHRFLDLADPLSTHSTWATMSAIFCSGTIFTRRTARCSSTDSPAPQPMIRDVLSPLALAAFSHSTRNPFSKAKRLTTRASGRSGTAPTTQRFTRRHTRPLARAFTLSKPRARNRATVQEVEDKVRRRKTVKDKHEKTRTES